MEAIPNQRAIIDRRDLAAALDAVAGERLDPAAERARLLAELKHALAAGRAAISKIDAAYPMNCGLSPLCTLNLVETYPSPFQNPAVRSKLGPVLGSRR